MIKDNQYTKNYKLVIFDDKQMQEFSYNKHDYKTLYISSKIRRHSRNIDISIQTYSIQDFKKFLLHYYAYDCESVFNELDKLLDKNIPNDELDIPIEIPDNKSINSTILAKKVHFEDEVKELDSPTRIPDNEDEVQELDIPTEIPDNKDEVKELDIPIEIPDNEDEFKDTPTKIPDNEDEVQELDIPIEIPDNEDEVKELDDDPISDNIIHIKEALIHYANAMACFEQMKNNIQSKKPLEKEEITKQIAEVIEFISEIAAFNERYIDKKYNDHKSNVRDYLSAYGSINYPEMRLNNDEVNIWVKQYNAEVVNRATYEKFAMLDFQIQFDESNHFKHIGHYDTTIALSSLLIEMIENIYDIEFSNTRKAFLHLCLSSICDPERAQIDDQYNRFYVSYTESNMCRNKAECIEILTNAAIQMQNNKQAAVQEDYFKLFVKDLEKANHFEKKYNTHQDMIKSQNDMQINNQNKLQKV